MNNPRRFAIGDVHGCLATLKALLYQKIKLRKEDRLFFLGDYVHRGPDSLGVLEEIIGLAERGYSIQALMGNHELMFLEEQSSLDDRYRNFISNLPYFHETSDFYFVHAELNFYQDDPLKDTQSMVWGASYPIKPDLDFLGKRKVIHGHTITSLSTIFDAIHDGSAIIPLDNGCYKAFFEGSAGIGNLCALDLNEMRLLVQENIDRLQTII